MFNEEVFWKDGFEGECRGGIFTRAVDLKKFLVVKLLDYDSAITI
jgi:hypothetical protein